MIRTQWTRKQVNQTGGYGDKILAATNDPERSWYWRELHPERGIFNFEFRPRPGWLTFDRALAEIADVADAVLIEPHVKRTFSADNRDWGFARWQQLVFELPMIRFVQCLHDGLPQLQGVDVLYTSSFDHAVAALAASRGFLGTPSGLSHAAGALRARAVVVFGGFCPAEVLGYAWHHNIAEPDADALGWRRNHPACRAALERISVERVAGAVFASFGPSADARANRAAP